MSQIIVTVRSGRAFADDPQWGYRATVDRDGDVLVLDEVAGHFTNCHSLSKRQRNYIRRQVALQQAADALSPHDGQEAQQ